MKVTLASGFECDVNENILNKVVTLKALGMCESKNAGERLVGSLKLIELFLGEEQEKAFVDYLDQKAEDGMAEGDAYYHAAVEIMNAFNESKKNS